MYHKNQIEEYKGRTTFNFYFLVIFEKMLCIYGEYNEQWEKQCSGSSSSFAELRL